MPINFPTEVDIWEIRFQILPLMKFHKPHEENMAAAKRASPEKGIFLGLESGETIRTHEIKPKKLKVDTEKMYPIEASG